MEDSQQLLDSEDEKQAETDVEIESQNASKETYNPRKNHDHNWILVEKFCKP